MDRFIKMKYLFLPLYLIFGSCSFEKYKSEFFCDGTNCFTVIQFEKFTNPENGIYFCYGKIPANKPQNNFVFVRYTDGPFYYRWHNDTLVLRCPYWKVIEDKTTRDTFFDFNDHFTKEEKLKYGYDLDVQQFYKNISKDFKKINTYQLK